MNFELHAVGGEVPAFSEMLDHVALSREFYDPVVAAFPGVTGFEICESLFANRKNKKVIAEKFSVRRVRGTQQLLGNKVLGNAFRPPGLERPAEGLIKVKSDSVPLLRLLESGASIPGTLGPLRGFPSIEGGGKPLYSAFPPI